MSNFNNTQWVPDNTSKNWYSINNIDFTFENTQIINVNNNLPNSANIIKPAFICVDNFNNSSQIILTMGVKILVVPALTRASFMFDDSLNSVTLFSGYGSCIVYLSILKMFEDLDNQSIISSNGILKSTITQYWASFTALVVGTIRIVLPPMGFRATGYEYIVFSIVVPTLATVSVKASWSFGNNLTLLSQQNQYGALSDSTLLVFGATISAIIGGTGSWIDVTSNMPTAANECVWMVASLNGIDQVNPINAVNLVTARSSDTFKNSLPIKIMRGPSIVATKPKRLILIISGGPRNNASENGMTILDMYNTEFTAQLLYGGVTSSKFNIAMGYSYNNNSGTVDNILLSTDLAGSGNFFNAICVIAFNGIN